MRVELGTDRDDRVYARWAPGGPWTVLDRDGRVTTEPHALGATSWCEDESDEDFGIDVTSENYKQGFADGHASGVTDERERKPVRSAS